jgi:hypothetical protein
MLRSVYVDRSHYSVGRHIFVTGLLVLVFVASTYRAKADEARPQVGSVCRGFVVLPNGYAVLSGMPAAHEHEGRQAHHDASHQTKAMAPQHEQMQHKSHGHAEGMRQPAGAPPHLMGYRHGQDILLQEGMLCVPIGRQDDTTWATVSRDSSLSVTAESLRGALTHNSRANEALMLTVRRGDAGAVEAQTQVRLLTRMPHHDRRMPGGHGLANDPDVQGLEAQLDKDGRYRLPTIDFSMAGAWLVEVQVQQSGNTYRAYFAIDVGEE